MRYSTHPDISPGVSRIGDCVGMYLHFKFLKEELNSAGPIGTHSLGASPPYTYFCMLSGPPRAARTALGLKKFPVVSFESDNSFFFSSQAATDL